MKCTTMKHKAYGTLAFSDLGEFAVEGFSFMPFRRKSSSYSEKTCSDSNNVCQNWASTQTCLVYCGTDDGRVRSGRKEKIERKEGTLDDAFKRSYDL